MLLILPPSEGKNAPTRGRPADLDALAFPELRPLREQAVAALQALSLGDPAAALAELKLGPKSRAELARNHDLLAAPTATAARIYTGVLFDRLDLATLDAAARRRANKHLLISSALWGVVRPGDRIPAYRHPASARLPGLPTMQRHWRAALDRALPADQLTVDLRSGGYRDLWRGPADAPTVVVNVVRDGPTGRSVVSHNAKAARGEVGRILLQDARIWRRKATPERVAESVTAAGWNVELGAADAHGSVELTIVEAA